MLAVAYEHMVTLSGVQAREEHCCTRDEVKSGRALGPEARMSLSYIWRCLCSGCVIARLRGGSGWLTQGGGL
jgi:hypothetical protein